MSARVVAVTQARMTSTRLPGKVLKTVRGRTLLDWHLERLKRCAALSDIVLATTTNAADEPLIAAAEAAGVRWFRGPEDDVLTRYVGAAREVAAEIVVRVTSDCPLWDPEEGGRVVAALCDPPPTDYAANTLERTLPRGLDTEAFSAEVLERLQRLIPPGPSPEREHVTFAVHTSRRELFPRRAVRSAAGRDDSDLRWCVDTPEDLRCLTAIIEGLDDPLAPYPEVLKFVRARPEISKLNAAVEQKKSRGHERETG